MGEYVFETERLIVCKFSFPEDADNFFSINGDKEVMQYIRAPKTKTECDEFLKEVVAGYETDKGRGRWAVIEKVTGEFVGSYAFIPVTGTDDYQLGYALLKKHWGRGFATELMREGIRYSFDTTDLKKIFGITEAINVPSQKVLLKTGFLLFSKYKEAGKEVCKFKLSRPAS
jgi:RimJ/RimL family protein N-acetyltransferase